MKVRSVENLNFDIQEIDKEFYMKFVEYNQKLPKADWNMTWMVIGGGEGNRIAGASQSYFEKERLMNKQILLMLISK